MTYIKVEIPRGYTLINEDDTHLMDGYAWHFDVSGYIVRRAWKDGKCVKNIRLHRLVIGAKDGQYVDHINENKADNRKENLRIATYSQNLACRGPYKNNTSGYKGVSWDKRRKVWMVLLGYQGKRIYVGSFNDKNKAAQMYNIKAKEIFGDFAYQNVL